LIFVDVISIALGMCRRIIEFWHDTFDHKLTVEVPLRPVRIVGLGTQSKVI